MRKEHQSGREQFKITWCYCSAKILGYVAGLDYSGVLITEWERRATEQEVGLSNGVD